MSGNGAAEYAALVNRYMDGGYTDGLPVIPPYREAVDTMVAASRRPAGEMLGPVPPQNNPATIETVAINAVMAGCLPEYMPVVVTALEAMLEPAFNLTSPACTTKGVAPLVIVNGPIRHRLNINCRGNVFGPGHRANATIGRALRLIMINVGGARSQQLDKATFGHPGKYTYVIGEDEEGSPWSPLHVDLGFRPDESTVTVMPSEAPRQIGNFDPRAGGRELLLSLADAMSSLTYFGATGYIESVAVLIGPEHRQILQGERWSKAGVREFLAANCRRKSGALKRIVDNGRGGERGTAYGWSRDEDDDDRWVDLFDSAERIKVVSAGGAGRFSVICWGFASDKFCRTITRRIPDVDI